MRFCLCVRTAVRQPRMLNRYRNVKTEDLLYLVGHEQKHILWVIIWYQYQSENESIVSVCDAFDWLTDIYICRFWSVMSRNTYGASLKMKSKKI